MDKFVIKEKLDNKLYIHKPTGCWLWTGTRSSADYGIIRIENKNYFVHRLSLWIYKKFDLSSPLLACHIVTCPFRHCFNPEHLYAGDKSDNGLDAVKTGTSYQSTKTHCVHGHEFTKKNTITSSTRHGRSCRKCHNLLVAKRKKNAKN